MTAVSIEDFIFCDCITTNAMCAMVLSKIVSGLIKLVLVCHKRSSLLKASFNGNKGKK
jgi:hypothetical protein